jgi:hypothetical protein
MASLLMTIMVHASEVLALRVKNQKVLFFSDPGKHLTISKNCLRNHQFECKAYSAFLEVAESTTATEKPPTEVSAALCKMHKGQTTMGFTERKDEMGLCYFKSDGSYIDLGSLYAKSMGWN